MELQLIMMKSAQPNLSQHMWKTLIYSQEWCVLVLDIYVSTLLSMHIIYLYNWPFRQCFFEDDAQVYVYSFQATTQVFGSCTYHFGGTSAATPIMSSIVALTLEAK